MENSGKKAWILKKAYEIAYAVFRIAGPMGENREFAGYFKNAATALLGATAGEDYPVAMRALSTLEYLVRFAGDVNIIGMANAEILLNEIRSLGMGIGEMNQFAEPGKPEPDLSVIFSSGKFPENDNPAKHPIRQKVEQAESGKQESGNQEIESDESGNWQSGKTDDIPKVDEGNGEISIILKSAIRQSAILERIRQIGNCRMKDILEFLPNASERTIRYDLQDMIEQNLIERVGIGGPSVYYRIRPGAPEGMQTVDNVG